MARPRNVSDEEILEAARDCFLDDPNTPTTTIAQRVGLSQAALFKRFGTKMRLMLEAMADKPLPPWKPLAEAGPDARPVPDQLTELGIVVATFFATMIPRVAAMKAVGVHFHEMFGKDRVPPPVEGYLALRDWFQRAMDQGLVRQGDAGGLAIAFVGMFQGRAFWRHFAGGHFPSPMPDDEDYVRYVVQIFWQGIAPDEEAP